jgi:hypothetical protein
MGMAYHIDAFLEKYKEKGVEVLFLISHSSDQCQPFDLLTFSLLKKYFSSSAFHGFHTAPLGPEARKSMKLPTEDTQNRQ